MGAPTKPYQPYADSHAEMDGPGDARPTAFKVLEDCGKLGKLANKTVVITGCSSGIGVATAAALYASGAKLLLTARDMPKLEKVIDEIVNQPLAPTNAPRPEAIELHLDSLAGVRKGAELIRQKTGSLNILIENAGVMAIPELSHTVDGFETSIGVNHFAHFLLFELLKPLLLQGAKDSRTTSRVIILSSAGHRYSEIRFEDMHWKQQPDTYQKWQAYGQSKTANIYMANSVHRHHGSQGITAVSVHPGGIMTELGRFLTPEDYASFGPREALEKIFKSPQQGAATTVWAAVSDHFEDVTNGGKYLADVGESAPADAAMNVGGPEYAAYAYDEKSEEKLWKITREAVGVDGE